MPTIISADEIKKELPNYDPSHVELFHRESARKADKMFEQFLKDNPFNEVILLSGGTASGKTEFMVTQLNSKKCIIFDTTLPTQSGAKIKIKKIHKMNKKAVIYSVIPDDLTRAFIAFLNRDRKFKDEHFYRTHAGSRKTLLWVAENYSEVEINIIESSYTQQQVLQFDKIAFSNKEKLIAYLRSIQMIESDIIKSIKI